MRFRWADLAVRDGLAKGLHRAEAGTALVSCSAILCAVLVLALGSQQQVRHAHALVANQIDRNMALHAAEAALLDAEAAIQSAPAGFVADAASDPLQVHRYGELTGNRMHVLRPAQYQIDVVSTSPSGSSYFYRITAKGFGQRGSTQVVLQADFIWSPAWGGRIAWRELSGG